MLNSAGNKRPVGHSHYYLPKIVLSFTSITCFPAFPLLLKPLSLISQDLCDRYDTVWKEDRWLIIDKIHEKRMSGLTKRGKKLTDLLSKNLEGLESMEGKLLPSSILMGLKDYQVRRRLGNSGRYKEITWLGESFVIRQISGDVKALEPEIASLLSLSHTNIMEFLCGFVDHEKKECLLVMEPMSRNLSTYIKDVYGPRKRIQSTLPVAVDLMLQIARGMEYLPLVWYAPEVLEELEQTGSSKNYMYTEKSDVYSFGMVCFELLTGKVPFDDNHFQGDKMSR